MSCCLPVANAFRDSFQTRRRQVEPMSVSYAAEVEYSPLQRIVDNDIQWTLDYLNTKVCDSYCNNDFFNNQCLVKYHHLCCLTSKTINLRLRSPSEDIFNDVPFIGIQLRHLAPLFTVGVA